MKTTSRKDLEYYMNLPYEVSVRKLRDSEGGGYLAAIPELGESAFNGDGDTPEEALASLDEIKRYLFEGYIRDGIDIPEPFNAEEFSGKFIVRVPRELHCKLAIEAKRNGCSLNQYITYKLSEAVTPSTCPNKASAGHDKTTWLCDFKAAESDYSMAA